MTPVIESAALAHLPSLFQVRCMPILTTIGQFFGKKCNGLGESGRDPVPPQFCGSHIQ
jgi:hypothetical protein